MKYLGCDADKRGIEEHQCELGDEEREDLKRGDEEASAGSFFSERPSADAFHHSDVGRASLKSVSCQWSECASACPAGVRPGTVMASASITGGV